MIPLERVALFTWMGTVAFGLILLVIWLMEYDREFQSAAATRLPVPVISAHALLGMGGLLLWAVYLLADEERLAWVTIADLGTVALLGLVMAARWIRHLPVVEQGRVLGVVSIRDVAGVFAALVPGSPGVAHEFDQLVRERRLARIEQGDLD